MLRRVGLILCIFVGFVVGQPSALACKPISERIAEGVAIMGVSNVTHLSTSGMNLYLDVDNTTRYRVVISDAEVDVLSGDEVVATISLRDKVVVKRKQRGDVLLPLRFKARTTFVLGKLLRRMVEQRDNMAISYRVRGGVGCFRRTISEESVALESLFASGVLAEAMMNNVRDMVENL